MTLKRIESGLTFFPGVLGSLSLDPSGLTIGTHIIDAATEKACFIGHVSWAGGGTKTMGASSSVSFRTGAVTMASVSTTVRVGIQDVSTLGFTGALPDGTYGVYREFLGDSGVIGSADDFVVKEITLSTAGSKDIANGSLVAVVIEMTTRGGSDSLTVTYLANGARGRPTTRSFAIAWSALTGLPMVMLKADDGTYGVLLGAFLASAITTTAYVGSTVPDERGLIFQVPFRCKADSVRMHLAGNSGTAHLYLRIYGSPLTTPTVLAEAQVYGSTLIDSTTPVPMTIMFDSGAEATLEPGVDYCLAAQALISEISISQLTVNADHRSAMGLVNCRLGTRSDNTGAFSETTTIIPMMSIGLSALDDGNGLGRASFNIGV